MNDILSSRLLNIEQEILINRFLTAFNYDSPGNNRHIANYEQLFYMGTFAGSEFTVYAATKMYICFDYFCSYSAAAANAFGRVDFYNENNVINLYGQNNSIAYEAVAAQIWNNKNNVHIKNFWFSRINVTQYNSMKFIGYRITLD